MASWIIVVAISIAAVGAMAIGLSLTLMIKGHPMQSEISTNPNMQRLGIKCAVQEAREAQGTDCSQPSCGHDCAACEIETPAQSRA